jgi:Arc/MetJ-type ribon-helix-helix transcriptional regulator
MRWRLILTAAMHIDIAPETERLVHEEISSGHFRSADELIKAGVKSPARNERHRRVWSQAEGDRRRESARICAMAKKPPRYAAPF